MKKKKQETTPHPERGIRNISSTLLSMGKKGFRCDDDVIQYVRKRYSALGRHLIPKKRISVYHIARSSADPQIDSENKDDCNDFIRELGVDASSSSSWESDSDSDDDTSEDFLDDIDDDDEEEEDDADADEEEDDDDDADEEDFSSSDSESSEYSSPENPRFSDGRFAEKGISPAIYPERNVEFLNLDLCFDEPKLTSTQLECQNENISDLPEYSTPKAGTSKKPRKIFYSTDSDTVVNDRAYVPNKRVPIISSSDSDENVTVLFQPEHCETIMDSDDEDPETISPIVPVKVDGTCIPPTNFIIETTEEDRTTVEIHPERLETELDIEIENTKHQETLQRQESDVNSSKKRGIFNKVSSWLEEQKKDSKSAAEESHPERLESELDIETENRKDKKTPQRQACDLNYFKEGEILDKLPIWLQEQNKDFQNTAVSCITTVNTEDIVDNVFKDFEDTSSLNLDYAHISAEDLSAVIVDSVQNTEVTKQCRKDSPQRKPVTVKRKYEIDGGNEALSNGIQSGNFKRKNNKNKKKQRRKDIALEHITSALFDAGDSSSLHSVGNVDIELDEGSSAAANRSAKNLDGRKKKLSSSKAGFRGNRAKFFSKKNQKKKRNSRKKQAVNSYLRSTRTRARSFENTPSFNADKSNKLHDPYHFTSAESDSEEEITLRKKSSTRKKTTRSFQAKSSSESAFDSKKKVVKRYNTIRDLTEEETEARIEILKSFPICPLAITKTPFFASKRVAK